MTGLTLRIFDDNDEDIDDDDPLLRNCSKSVSWRFANGAGSTEKGKRKSKEKVKRFDRALPEIEVKINLNEPPCFKINGALLCR